MTLPITLPILHKLISISHNISTSAYETFLVSAKFSLMFHAFLQIGKVTSSPHNIQFSQLAISNQITLQFNSFKHHTGPPFSLHIPRSQSSSYCPVQLMSYYIAARGRSPGPLFCYMDLQPISPQRFRAILKLALARANIQTQNLTPHSFCIGAAT